MKDINEKKTSKLKSLDVLIIKKDGTEEKYDIEKVVKAVNKSAIRTMVKFTDDEIYNICKTVNKTVRATGCDKIEVTIMHNIVEKVLQDINPEVAESYRNYRNYKTDFVHMLDKVYQESQRIMYLGDKENSNVDSSLVSTKRSLIYNELSRELYKKFFLTKEELEAVNEGYIYVHDMNARLNTMNCSLFNVAEVLKGGFEMGNLKYSEPNSLDTAFDVIADIAAVACAQQYGGWTIPEIDKILEPYAKKSYSYYYQKYIDLGVNEDKADKQALLDVEKIFDQGFQGFEYKFNSVGSSRGDYPFLTITSGLSDTKFGIMCNLSMLKTRKNGQGEEGHKKPVLFPKIVFLYDKEVHGKGKKLYSVYQATIECSSKCMYPDFLSLSGDSYVARVYKKYGKVISPMGCRAFLSLWFERGGEKPADENDVPVFEGRFNIGAISLHLPMILAKARQENRDFYEILDYYLNLIRNLHIRTYEYLGEMKASVHPLGYCEGGFYGGHLKPSDKIKPLLKPMTASFGITALNELQQLYNHKSLVEDGEFALEVMKHINNKIEEFKKEDGWLYAIYAVPAENLCGVQVKQFRQKYGIIENVSDREYVSNGFHCHVTENITPTEKQDYEKRFWDLCNGGKIQYVKYPIDYNIEAMYTLVERAMDMGFYEGINMSLSYCNDCGYEELSMDVCPKCGSKNLTKIDRMNGYLSYSRVNGDTRLNAAKMAEIKDRKSM